MMHIHATQINLLIKKFMMFMKKINFLQNVLLRQYGFPAGNNGLFSKKSLLTMAKTFPKTLGMFLFIFLLGAGQANVVKAENELVPKDLSGLLTTIPKVGESKPQLKLPEFLSAGISINWYKRIGSAAYVVDPSPIIDTANRYAAEIVIPKVKLEAGWTWPTAIEQEPTYFIFDGADSIRAYKKTAAVLGGTNSQDTVSIAIFFHSDSLIKIITKGTDTTDWITAITNAMPIPGNKPATLETVNLPDNYTFTVKEVKWKTRDREVLNDERFAFNTDYSAEITVTPKTGFTTYNFPTKAFELGWRNGFHSLSEYGSTFENALCIGSTSDEATVKISFPKTYTRHFEIDSINLEPIRKPRAGFELTDTTKIERTSNPKNEFPIVDSTCYLSEFEWKTKDGSAVSSRFDRETEYVLTSKIRLKRSTLYENALDSVKYRFKGYGNNKVDSVLMLKTKVDIDPDSAHKGMLSIYFPKTEKTIALDSVTSKFKAPRANEPLVSDTFYCEIPNKQDSPEDTILYKASIEWYKYHNYGKSDESIGTDKKNNDTIRQGDPCIAKIIIDSVHKDWTNYMIETEVIRKWAGNNLKKLESTVKGLEANDGRRDSLIITVFFKALPKTVTLEPDDWKHLYPRGDETPKTSVGGEPLNYKGTVEWKYNDGTEVKIETEKFRKNVVYTAHVTLEARDGFGVEGFKQTDLDAIAHTIDSVAKSTEGFTGNVTESVKQDGIVVIITYKATQGGVLLPINTNQALELYGIPVVDENMDDWKSAVKEVEGNLITPKSVSGVSDKTALIWGPNPTGGGVFNATDEYNTVLAVEAVPGYKLSNTQYIKIAGSHRLEVLSASDEGTTLLKIYVRALPLVRERNLAISAVVGSAPQRSMAATAELQESPITWKRGEIELGDDDVFESGTTYKAELTVRPQEGYTLAGLRENFFRVLGHSTKHDEVDRTKVAIGKDSVNVTVTFAEATTGIQNIQASGVKVSSAGGVLKVNGLSAGEAVSVYNLQGALVYRQAAVSGEQKIDLASGIYIVVTEKAKVKVLHKK
jgi:hypothetical protein